MAPDSDVAMKRLERLERQMRRWKMLAAAALVGASALALMGFELSGPPIVAAQRFVVTDANGTPRASFGLVGDGSPVIGFNDKDGITRMMVGMIDGQPEVVLTASDGTVRWKAR